MFQPVRCPACKAILFEYENEGSSIRKICRCGRMVHMDQLGNVRIISDTAKKLHRNENLVTQRA